MKWLAVLLVMLGSSAARAAGPQPCYFSGQYVRCFPPAGISGVDGTVSLPSYSFTSDLDVGMYRIGANDLGFAVNGVLNLEVTTTGIKSTSITWTDTTKGILGTVTNNDAAAGYVGEYLESKVTTATTISASATLFDVTSKVLTAGDWDCSGGVLFERNGATFTNAEFQTGIGCAATTGNTGLQAMTSSTDVDLGSGANVVTFGDFGILTPNVRIQSDGTNLYMIGVTCSSVQTIYLKGYTASFTGVGGPPKYRGTLRCRRVR